MIVAAELRGPADNGVVLDECSRRPAPPRRPRRRRPRCEHSVPIAPTAKRWLEDRWYRMHGDRCPGIGSAHRAFSTAAGGRGLHRLEINHLAHKRGFGGQLAAHGGAALKLAETVAPGQHVHFKAQLVAGNHGAAEARVVDGYEIEQLFFAVRHFLQAAASPRFAPWTR